MKKFLKTILKNRKVFYSSMLLAAVTPLAVNAQEGIGKIASFIGWLIEHAIINIAVYLLQAELWILPIIAQYNYFTSEPGVQTGWEALRDLSNMFFILILLVIAFATILRFQNYGYKQLLSKFLLMAILINFSMTITGLLIDISQVVMLTFVSAIADVAAGNIIVSLGLDGILTIADGAINAPLDDASYITAMLMGGIMMIISVIVVFVFIAMLAIRIVMLWILTVISPLAFVAFTFPKTKKYFDNWSDELSKYLVSGPLLVFFLWLAFTIVGNGDISSTFALRQGDDPINTYTQALTTPKIINFTIGIAMLLGGLKTAAASGVAAAGIAGGAVSGIQRASSKAARGVSRRALVGSSGSGGLKGVGLATAGGTAAGLRKLVGGAGKKLESFDSLKGAGQGINYATLGLAGAAGRAVKRVGTRIEGASSANRSAQSQYILDRTKGMTSEQRDRYLESAAGGNRVTSAAAQRALDIQRVQTGYYKTSREDPKHVRDQKQAELKQAVKRLSKGGAQEQEAANQAKAQDLTLANKDAYGERTRKDGAVKVIQEMSMLQAAQGGSLTSEQIDVLSEVLSSSQKQISEAISGKTDEEKEAFAKVVNKLLSATDSKGRKVFDKETLFKKGADGKNKVDGDSRSYKALSTLVKLDPKSAQTVFESMEAGEQELVAKALSKDLEAKEIVKTGASEPIFSAVTKQIDNEKKVTEVAQGASTKNKKVLVQARLAAGDIKSVVNSPALYDAVDEEDREPIVEQYFDRQVNLNVDVAGNPKTDENGAPILDPSTNDAPARSEAEKAKKKLDLATKNIEHAHIIFKGDIEGLARFINNKLTSIEAQKINKETLQDPELFSRLKPAMQSAFVEVGIAPDEPAEEAA